MTIKQKIVMVAIAFCLSVVAGGLVPAPNTFAEETTTPISCQTDPKGDRCQFCKDNPTSSAEDCAKVPAPGATDTTNATDGTAKSSASTEDNCDPSKEKCCGTVRTSIIGDEICKGSGDSKTAEGSTIWRLLMFVLNVMTAGIGIAAVGGIVYGALLYTTAEDKPDQTKKAIGIITNVVIGLAGYGLMYVLLNFLIPGGIFS